VSAIALGLFLVVELPAARRCLQLKFFRSGTFSGANLVGVIVSFAFFGVNLLPCRCSFGAKGGGGLAGA